MKHAFRRLLVTTVVLTGAAATCASAQPAPAIALYAVCAEPDAAHAGQQLIQFGYANTYTGDGGGLDRSYGAANVVTIDGVDAGPLSGAPAHFDAAVRGNAFTVRAAATASVIWSVLDPVTATLQSATPGPATPRCNPSGPDGASGAQGPQGAQGIAGAAGVAGAEGAQGPPGVTGPDGTAGATGMKGANGPAGAEGAAGPQGPSGPEGPVGPLGLRGSIGAPGVAGAIGPAGPQGPAGLAGLPGATGARGAEGSKGPTGDAGAIGLPGAAGSQGAAGPAGLKGPTGDPGADGLPGAIGPKGDPGSVEAGELHLLASDPAPAGYVLVATYREKMDKSSPKDTDDKWIDVRVYRRSGGGSI
jgi:hypothetical protein